MSWTDHVECWSCHNAEWQVIDGTWTCTCGAAMNTAAIAAYHRTLS